VHYDTTNHVIPHEDAESPTHPGKTKTRCPLTRAWQKISKNRFRTYSAVLFFCYMPLPIFRPDGAL